MLVFVQCALVNDHSEECILGTVYAMMNFTVRSYLTNKYDFFVFILVAADVLKDLFDVVTEFLIRCMTK
jgi:hypothetical protein